MKKVFPAVLSELANVLAFTDSELEKAGCPIKTQTSVDVALEELFVNVASYAYPDGNGTAEIEVIADESERYVSVRICDSGLEFDPMAKPDPDTTLKANERQIGGLGIYMVKKMMDTVDYEYADGLNIITIKKAF